MIRILLLVIYKACNLLPYTNAKLNLGQRYIRQKVAQRLMASCGEPVTIGKNIHISWSKVSLGSRSGIGNNSKIEGAYIGNNVLMGERCHIYAKNHNYIDKNTLIIEQGYTSDKIVCIADDVWIGDDVKILPGVLIGEGAVIGTGAIVTKNIEPYSVAVGNPAKVISKRI